MNKLLFLILLPWSGMLYPMMNAETNTIVEQYAIQAQMAFPTLTQNIDLIKNKVTSYAQQKNRLQDEEYIKVLFMHYLLITEINMNLLIGADT